MVDKVTMMVKTQWRWYNEWQYHQLNASWGDVSDWRESACASSLKINTQRLTWDKLSVCMNNLHTHLIEQDAGLVEDKSLSRWCARSIWDVNERRSKCWWDLAKIFQVCDYISMFNFSSPMLLFHHPGHPPQFLFISGLNGPNDWGSPTNQDNTCHWWALIIRHTDNLNLNGPYNVSCTCWSNTLLYVVELLLQLTCWEECTEGMIVVAG